MDERLPQLERRRHVSNRVPNGRGALVEHVGRTQIDQDALVYPIVFCYRQYLELLLKVWQWPEPVG